MLVLGIESTCDETAASVVVDGKTILSQVVASQIDLHDLFGGVVPELACRRHIDAIMPVITQALNEANKTIHDIDLIAVANGPGLIGALLIGIHAAKGLAFALDKPLVGVNHVEAHLYASMMSHQNPITLPAIGIVLSGGHTSLLYIKDIGKYELIGQTVDDAIGEAFDKVAKLLSLPYPGGPQIEKLAESGNADAFKFKCGNVKGKPFDFSFSGLKTAVMYTMRTLNLQEKGVIENLSASFQKTAFQDILLKAEAAAKEFNCRNIIFGGGVTNNRYLRAKFHESYLNCFFPDFHLTLDNAAMIAGLGYHVYKQNGPADLYHLEAKTRISFPIFS